MDRISLHSFSTEYQLNKSTVYRKCQDLKIATSDGLLVADCDRLLVAFGIVKPEPEVIKPEIMPDDFIKGGELAAVKSREIQLPQGFDPAAMVRLFDGVAGEATDTASLVAIADMAINAVESAMDSKLLEQRQKLAQAEQDAKALTEKINASKVKLHVKALESKILAERQTTATQTAEQLFAELMSMGKPAADGSGQS